MDHGCDDRYFGVRLHPRPGIRAKRATCRVGTVEPGDWINPNVEAAAAAHAATAAIPNDSAGWLFTCSPIFHSGTGSATRTKAAAITGTRTPAGDCPAHSVAGKPHRVGRGFEGVHD